MSFELRKVPSSVTDTPTHSQLRELLDGGHELETIGKKFSSSGVHEFVRLADGDLSHTCDVADLLLSLLVL